MQKDIVYPELSYKLTGLFMKIQSELGRFCKEKQYADALEALLKKEDLRYQREQANDFLLEEVRIKGNRSDFIVEDKILIEIKVIPYLTKRDYYQTARYLRAANLRLGLLINFRSEYIKPKRILNSSHHSH